MRTIARALELAHSAMEEVRGLSPGMVGMTCI